MSVAYLASCSPHWTRKWELCSFLSTYYSLDSARQADSLQHAFLRDKLCPAATSHETHPAMSTDRFIQITLFHTDAGLLQNITHSVLCTPNARERPIGQ